LPDFLLFIVFLRDGPGVPADMTKGTLVYTAGAAPGGRAEIPADVAQARSTEEGLVMVALSPFRKDWVSAPTSEASRVCVERLGDASMKFVGIRVDDGLA